MGRPRRDQRIGGPLKRWIGQSLADWGRQFRRASPWIPAALTTALAAGGGHLPGIHCPLRTLTGIPCPTCYLTRATAAALQGKLLEAVQLHLFGPAVAGLLLVWSARGILQGRLVPPRLPGPALVVAASTLMLYWLLRLVAHYGHGLPAFPS